MATISGSEPPMWQVWLTPVFTFLLGGWPGFLKPPPLVSAPPTWVKVPPLNHRSSSALRFLLSSACILGSTSSRPCTGVNASDDATPVPVPPSDEPTPDVRRPLPRRSMLEAPAWPNPRKDEAAPPSDEAAPQPLFLALSLAR
ncbi:hypothetical protein BN1723_001054, partial [Verticillium longisporum]